MSPSSSFSRWNVGRGSTFAHFTLPSLSIISRAYLSARAPHRSWWSTSAAATRDALLPLVSASFTNRPIATPCSMSKTFSSLPPPGAVSFFFALPCRSSTASESKADSSAQRIPRKVGLSM